MTPKQRAALDGSTIRFYHLRYASEPSAAWCDPRSKHFLRLSGLTIDPRGGITRAVIEWPDGNTSVTEAKCSRRDNFCKAIGRNIAVGRAIKLREWALSGEPS